MFDSGLNGNWIIWYKTPSGDIRKTVPMKKRYAFGRYNLHSDAIAIEKIKGLFKRKINKYK